MGEAIVNAIAHRDYHSNASIEVRLFADRLEVWNPGTLPGTLTLDDLRDSHPSVPNNPLIAESLYLTRYIEKVGSGTQRMIELCREANLPEPDFGLRAGSFVVTLWRDWLTDEVVAQLSLNDRQRQSVLIAKTSGRLGNLGNIKRPLASQSQRHQGIWRRWSGKASWKRSEPPAKERITSSIAKDSQRAQRAHEPNTMETAHEGLKRLMPTAAMGGKGAKVGTRHEPAKPVISEPVMNTPNPSRIHSQMAQTDHRKSDRHGTKWGHKAENGDISHVRDIASLFEGTRAVTRAAIDRGSPQDRQFDWVNPTSRMHLWNMQN